ncbi:MAG: sigma-54-dependent Fis family transcriptional regulator [Desulfobacteraceae bacterium]|nr:MAG: sigma-54-dependent Fis family transcriptional regulator [Desulfobacteraceae bacterium]
MSRILIVDDDKIMNDALSRAIQRTGHEVECRGSIREGLDEVYSNQYDVVYLDVRMPDGDGLESLTKFRKAPSAPEIIIMTGYANSKGAEMAIKSGAWDYVRKPSSIKEMTLPLLRVLQYRKNKIESEKSVALNLDGIVCSSPSIKECIDVVARAANCDANVLITGETGTGKELFAWAIHKNSARANKNFVVVDCTVLPETLVESLLFGHEKGAFTGAATSKEGLIKQADGGTVFLDEVGELPLSVQKRFLRVLQEHHFRPVGGKTEIHSNFRLIAATNRNLEAMVEAKHFRKDLIYRLKSLHINLPPLNKRKEDIRELLTYYLAKLCENNNIAIKGYSPEFFEALQAYDWPGNVREFINTIESVVAESLDSPILVPYHLPVNIRICATQASIGDTQKPITPSSISYDDISASTLPTLKGYRENGLMALEKEYLEKLLAVTKGNVKQACQVSDLSRSRLYGLMKKYEITRK